MVKKGIKHRKFLHRHLRYDGVRNPQGERQNEIVLKNKLTSVIIHGRNFEVSFKADNILEKNRCFGCINIAVKVPIIPWITSLYFLRECLHNQCFVHKNNKLLLERKPCIVNLPFFLFFKLKNYRGNLTHCEFSTRSSRSSDLHGSDSSILVQLGREEWVGIESLLIFVVDKVFCYIKSSDRNHAASVWSLKRT